MSLSKGTVLKSLAKHEIKAEWRADGKIYAEMHSPVLTNSGDIATKTDWVEVPTEPDAFLEWLGY